MHYTVDTMKRLQLLIFNYIYKIYIRRDSFENLYNAQNAEIFNK